MKVKEILLRLNRVRRSGNGWVARCPTHADKSPSLSIREVNGRVLLYCFARCSVEVVCAAIGIQIRDLFSTPVVVRNPKPTVVRYAEKQIVSLRSRLTPRDRERDVTVVLASRENTDPAIVRALALAVEGELVQLVLKEDAR